MQNVYRSGFAGSYADFVDHMAKLSPLAKLKMAGRTAVEWLTSRR